MTPIEHALVSFARILSENEIPYMIIGGMANAVWGEPRATIDIDVTIWFDETRAIRPLDLDLAQ